MSAPRSRWQLRLMLGTVSVSMLGTVSESVPEFPSSSCSTELESPSVLRDRSSMWLSTWVSQWCSTVWPSCSWSLATRCRPLHPGCYLQR